MVRNVFFLTAASLALLLLPGRRAEASSPFDGYAVDFLASGFDYAAAAYADNPDDWNAYDAYVYAYYAQYFADVASSYDDQICWDYAYAYGCYAASCALDAYYDTGDPCAYYAYVYCSDDYGAGYAYDAYIYFG